MEGRRGTIGPPLEGEGKVLFLAKPAESAEKIQKIEDPKKGFKDEKFYFPVASLARKSAYFFGSINPQITQIAQINSRTKK